MNTQTDEAIYHEGKVLLQKQEYDKALKCFGELAKTMPENPLICHYIGLADLRLGRTDAAMINFTRGEELLKHANFPEEDREKWEITFSRNRASAYYDLKDYKKAADIALAMVDYYLFE
jgi:tetratricopeptide (TPR) repeat protein